MEILRKIVLLLSVLVVLTGIGATGFHYLEGWAWLDSFYATVITLGTIGYGDFVPKTPEGRLFTMGLVLSGLGAISYTLLELTDFVVEGHLQRFLRKRRTDSQLKKLKGHFIVCGAGRTGEPLAAELLKNKVAFVTIDRDPAKLDRAPFNAQPCLVGDASDDALLLRAGIDKAAGLAAALETDEVNLFLVLTAKNLNPKIRCVTKLVHEASRPKLLRAGADALVAPNFIGGLRMASELVRPNVVSFLDVMLRQSKGVRFEEAPVAAGGRAAGRTLGDLDLPGSLGLTPVAVRDGGKDFIYNPGPQQKLKAGDTLVVIAEPEKIAKLRRLLGAA